MTMLEAAGEVRQTVQRHASLPIVQAALLIAAGLFAFVYTPVQSLVALGFLIGFQLVAEGIAIGGVAWAARRG